MARVYVRSITRSTIPKAPFSGTGIWKISSVACGFNSIKIDYSDYLKSLISRIISRIIEIYVVSIKYRYGDILLKKHYLHLSHLFCCNHTCYCVCIVSVTSGPCYITSASFYHPCYQSRSPMYIRGLIQRNFTELANAVPIAAAYQL